MEHLHHTRWAGTCAPTNEDARLLPGSTDQDKSASPDSAGPQADEQLGADNGKRFSTLRARLALAGWELSKANAGDALDVFYASRWNMARELHGLAAVATFADRVGAPS